MKTNLKQTLRHRWSESNSDIQIACWGQTTVGSVAVRGDGVPEANNKANTMMTNTNNMLLTCVDSLARLE